MASSTTDIPFFSGVKDPLGDEKTGASLERKFETTNSSISGSSKDGRTPDQIEADSSSSIIGGVLADVGQTAKDYLPASVFGVLEGVGVLSTSNTQTVHNDSTNPSSEESRSEPLAAGVGSLPGSSSEVGLAKLPEERVPEQKIGSDVGREDALTQPTICQDIAVTDIHSTEPITNMKPGGPGTASTTTAQQFLNSYLQPVPSLHHDGTDLHRLKNPQAEVNQQSPGTSSSTYDIKTDAADESTIQMNRNKPLPPPGGNTNMLPQDGKQYNDTTYATDQDKRQPARTSPNHAYTPPGSRVDLSATENMRGEEIDESDTVSSDSGSSSNSNHEKHKKTSFKQKLKGEVTILAGKIRKDPKKVERGHAMKEGHHIVNTPVE